MFKVCPDCATPGCPPQSLCIFPHPTSSTIPVCGSPCPASQAPSEPPALIQRPQQITLSNAADLTLTLTSQALSNPHEPGSQDQPLHIESHHKGSTQGWPLPSLAQPHSIPAPAVYRCSQGHSAFIPFNMNTKPEVPLRGAKHV